MLLASDEGCVLTFWLPNGPDVRPAGYFPLMKTLRDLSPLLYPATQPELDWMMQDAEKATLLQVLRVSRPAAALEIGTCNGGSLRHIREHARKTYSLDIDPTVRARLESRMPDVKFLTGDSAKLVPVVLADCHAAGTPLNFVLVDGDHRYEGVKSDLNAILTYSPPAPLWILMHDSSNPGCRRGILDAGWSGNPHVHVVELDFVAGALNAEEDFLDQIWGGFALALLLPEARTHQLEIGASLERHVDKLYRSSIHYPSLANALKRWTRIKWKGVKRRLGRS